MFIFTSMCLLLFACCWFLGGRCISYRHNFVEAFSVVLRSWCWINEHYPSFCPWNWNFFCSNFVTYDGERKYILEWKLLYFLCWAYYHTKPEAKALELLPVFILCKINTTLIFFNKVQVHFKHPASKLQRSDDQKQQQRNDHRNKRWSS